MCLGCKLPRLEHCLQQFNRSVILILVITKLITIIIITIIIIKCADSNNDGNYFYRLSLTLSLSGSTGLIFSPILFGLPQFLTPAVFPATSATVKRTITPRCI